MDCSHLSLFLCSFLPSPTTGTSRAAQGALHCITTGDVAFHSWLLSSNLKTNNRKKKPPHTSKKRKNRLENKCKQEENGSCCLKSNFLPCKCNQSCNTVFPGSLQPLVTKPRRITLPLFLPGDGRGLSKGQKFMRGCGCADTWRGACFRGTHGTTCTGKVTAAGRLGASPGGKGAERELRREGESWSVACGETGRGLCGERGR